MLNLREIHKPVTIQDAVRLLQEPGTVALAGGTELIAGQRRDVCAVVDMSALGLSYIRENAGAIAIGAMTTLTELNDSPILRALANGVIAQAAHRSAASVLRNQSTVAGTLITDPREAVVGRMANHRFWVVDGEPVAFASHAPLVESPDGAVGRVGPVYTPAGLRRRGYGAAVTSAVVEHLLPLTTTVMLFTDAANATSNGVYERLGFRVVADVVDLEIL